MIPFLRIFCLVLAGLLIGLPTGLPSIVAEPTEVEDLVGLTDRGAATVGRHQVQRSTAIPTPRHLHPNDRPTPVESPVTVPPQFRRHIVYCIWRE